MLSAASFEVAGTRADEVARRVREAVAALGGRVQGGMLFACGSLARRGRELANALVGATGDAPLLLACGAGVMTERGEHEAVAAAAGIVWRGGTCEPFVLSAEQGARPEAAVAATMRAAGAAGAGAFALFVQPEQAPAAVLLHALEGAPRARAFGGGVMAEPGAIVIARGKATAGAAVGLAIRGLSTPVVGVSTACRLLGELLPVTEAQGPMILSIGGTAATERLKEQAKRGRRREPILVAVEAGKPRRRCPRLLVRAIRGIHDGRRGVVASEPVAVGTRVAFAVRDPAVARVDLETTLRGMQREMAGAVPRFGVYVDCAARGSGLYGVGGVDAAMIRARWPTLPFAGLRTSFEIGPGGAGPAMHLCSGVLSLFRAPS
jgi:small ligand-binding sensory domain FIST